MRTQKSLLAAVLALALAPTAFASVDNKVLQLEDVRTQQEQIRVGVEARTGIYKDLPSATRSELLTKQGQMLRTIEGKSSTDDLSEQQKTEVFNTLEWIEATVNNAEDERIVCERRTVLGSNRKERVCKTVAQMREERDAARNQMDHGGVCMDCKSN